MITNTPRTEAEVLAYDSRWRNNGHVTYKANETGTFIAPDADYYHLYVTRNGRAVRVGSFGTLAEAKRAA